MSLEMTLIRRRTKLLGTSGTITKTGSLTYLIILIFRMSVPTTIFSKNMKMLEIMFSGKLKDLMQTSASYRMTYKRNMKISIKNGLIVLKVFSDSR